MNVKYISIGDGGVAESEDFEAGMTVEDLVAKKNGTMIGAAVRVNGRPAVAGQVLEDNDRVTITPANIKGA